jgi:ATP-dependent Clp protease ATP-binding subunit ClpA
MVITPRLTRNRPPARRGSRRLATEQARNRSHRYVGVEHLMLAILIEGQSIPAQVLERRVALSDALADLEQVMDSTNYGPSTTSQ